jgi:hypothetical protein
VTTRVTSGAKPRYFRALLIAAALSWLTFIFAFAVWGFVLPHPEPFAPEIGPLASFIFFGILLSLPFGIAFVVATLPSLLFLRPRLRHLKRWLWGIIGAGLFVIVFPVCSMSVAHTAADVILLAALAALPGFVAFVSSDKYAQVT